MQALQYPFDGAKILTQKRRLKKELLQKPGLVKKKVAILSGSTVGALRDMLELFLLNLGIAPEFFEGEYGLFYETAVFDGGALAAFAPDLVYVHTSNRNLRDWPAPADSAEAVAQKLEGELARYRAVWDALEKHGCPVVQNNFEEPLWRNFGSLDAADGRGRVSFVRALNAEFAKEAKTRGALYLHDLAWLAACHGLERWCDAESWYAYKYACAPAFIPTLAHSLAALVGALFGAVKKGVVLDLDNTLWGGVIGDEGAEGVEFGDETPTGMAYAELQGYLKTLSGRGILLAVASKNEKEAAQSGFERSDSVLKMEDFVAFEAHWQPKSGSVKAIAEALNILPESLVFFDDNPVERGEVTAVLPGVVAPEVGPPERSIALLDRGGYFEAAAVSGDDLKRGEMYRQNAKRASVADNFEHYDAYLKDLEMTADIGPFTPEHLERVTQLINKTNQFNLTTRRYSPEEVRARMEDPEVVTLAGRLVDKFGDNGITSALIATQTGDVLEVELWVMSCRVFRRQLEFAMFDALIAEAQKRGVREIVGRWLPTAKNLLVKDFYATIGFGLDEESDTERVFIRPVPQSHTPMNTVIKVNSG